MKLEDNLDEKLKKALDKNPKKESEIPNMSKEEEIGYHKGALNTLLNERNEFFKTLQIVESLMQAHVQRLQELGVKIQAGTENFGNSEKGKSKK